MSGGTNRRRLWQEDYSKWAEWDKRKEQRVRPFGDFPLLFTL
jgi:hypothetical protein